ncbi:exocyst complex component Sec10-domain-containing protein [Lipomyces oligophaga]|uniref:exocyst complex component Sec10-domain-containing protein n=1 Tax=Lipomyces oligophaga TaxID=45792 RepID=UPI0034CD0614
MTSYLDSEAPKLLTLDTFLQPITTKEFIERLTADYSTRTSSIESKSALDPQMYVQTFESSLEAISRISAELNSREQKIQAEARQSEISHQRTIAMVEAQCHTLSSQFSDLDLLVSDVASTTNSLGEAVDLVSRQRNRAASSSFIIQCYISFLSNDYELLEKLRTGASEDQRQCAITVRQLLRVARRITKIPRASEARDNVEKYAEMLERELLKSFDKAYRAADLGSMKRVADILTEFNGGTSVIQIFVNQHDFFIMKDKLIHEAVPEQNDWLWRQLSDPNTRDIPFDQGSLKLLNEIRDTVKNESIIIQRVFPHPESVLRVFLQRLFAQTIQQRIELILAQAHAVSTLAYLRALEQAHLHVSQLVEDLKTIIKSELNTPGQGLNMLLDQVMQDVFVPYIENRQYIETEHKNLLELASGLQVRFQSYYSSQRKAVTTMKSNSLRKWGNTRGRELWRRDKS